MWFYHKQPYFSSLLRTTAIPTRPTPRTLDKLGIRATTTMASTNSFQAQVPKLTKDNYRMWSIQTEAPLVSLDVWDLVENGYTEDESNRRLWVVLTV